MSWVFGIISSKSDRNFDVNKFKLIHPDPLFKISNKTRYIVAGGIKETCKCSTEISRNNSKGWIVCGLGIQYTDDKYSFLDTSDWDRILNITDFHLKDLDGHFVTLMWDSNVITIRNDQLGQRDMYFTKTNDFIAFSTRLDWIVRLRNDCALNIEAFSSSWMLENSLTYDCFITKIKRLGPGGSALLSQRSLNISFEPWLPKKNIKFDTSNPIELLRRFTLFPLSSGYKVDLGLSGGVDSRTLLSLLLSNDSRNWNVHSFGKTDMPDVLIAKQISKHFSLEHLLYYQPIPNINKIVKQFHEFIAQTLTFVPAHHFIDFGYYEQMYMKNKVIIDGGKGEYFRRVFANRLAIKGEKFLIDHNIPQIMKYLKIYKSSIFKDDVERLMENSCDIQIEQVLQSMPDLKDMNIGNWIDLFSIRYRTGNSGSVTQSLMDNFVLNYMPYIQPNLLNAIFQTPIRKRKSWSLNKKILKENKQLMKFKLEKYDTLIPFQLNILTSYISAKILRYSFRYHNLTQYDFLEVLENYIQDTYRSSEVRNYILYDYKKIKNVVELYYSGKKEFASELVWWLTFDVWRKILNEKNN